MKKTGFASTFAALVLASGSAAYADPYVNVNLEKYFPAGDWTAASGDAAGSASAIPTPPSEAVPGQTGSSAVPPWEADARDILKIWKARDPKTADPDLCDFAARELRAHGIPWRVALANWDYATSLKPRMKFSEDGMTAEGLTDASWNFCRDHPEAVRSLLGRKPQHSDMMNPRASILWWIKEFEMERQKLGGEGADPWRVARGVFYPAEPDGARAKLEQRRWEKTAAEQDRILNR